MHMRKKGKNENVDDSSKKLRGYFFAPKGKVPGREDYIIFIIGSRSAARDSKYEREKERNANELHPGAVSK